MSDDIPDDQEQRDRAVFERLASEFGPELALRNLEAKRAAREAGLPELKPRTRSASPPAPRKPDRETEKRVRERQAQILGIPQAELDRHVAGEKARKERTGRTGYQRIDTSIGSIAARYGVTKLAYDTCGRCGRKVPERNDLGGQPLRCDPGGTLGLLCNGFFDETGRDRIDCYEWREKEQAERNGRELAAARRDRADRAETSKHKKSRKGQLALVDDGEEPPFR